MIENLNAERIIKIYGCFFNTFILAMDRLHLLGRKGQHCPSMRGSLCLLSFLDSRLPCGLHPPRAEAFGNLVRELMQLHRGILKCRLLSKMNLNE